MVLHPTPTDDIYGPSTIDPEPTSRGIVVAKKRLVTRFTHCDTILAHGTISSMSFSLAKNGVSHSGPHWQVYISDPTGEVGSGAGSSHWVTPSRRVYTLPGMQFAGFMELGFD